MSEFSIEPLTTAVITLEFCNIFLLALLLVTPAPKHSIVKALTISCLLRSVLDVLPPIVHKVVPQRLGIRTVRSLGVINFCIVDSILLSYVTVVKAAFAVNFTLPFLWLALLQVKPKCSADDHPHLTKRMVLLLCISPFCRSKHYELEGRIANGTPASVEYNITSCYFDDPAFTIVSLIFTIVPLAISVVITTILAFVIWRFSDTMLERTGWLFVRTKRFARFGALVFVSMISACLWTVVLARWIHLRHTWLNGHGPWRDNVGWLHINRASVLWEAITPMLFFVIFAAQEEVYETWLRWLSCIVSLPRRLRDGKHDGRSGDSLRTSHHVTLSAAEEPYGAPSTSNVVAHDAEAIISAVIVARPSPPPFIRLSSYSERGDSGTRIIPALNGLTPAPRHGAITGAMEEPPQSTRSRWGFFSGPSLATFGSQFSIGSRGFTSSNSEGYRVKDSGSPSTADLESLSRECARAETPGSSTTFGRVGGGNRSMP